MVECQLPKLKVAGSNPVSRSIINRRTVFGILKMTIGANFQIIET
jgi:hypothetical protein